MNSQTINEYVIECVKHNIGFQETDWWVKAITLPKLTNEDVSKMKHGDLCLQDDGIYGVSEDKVLIKLVDYKPHEALIKLNDEIDVDSSVMVNIKEPVRVKTTLLLVNALAFQPEVRTALPFMNPGHPFATRYIENLLPNVVVDDDVPRTDKNISVEDMIRVIDNLNFIESLAGLIVTSGSKKSITPAPGIDQYRNKLIKEAGKDLSDPVKLTEVENKIQAYDKEYLKDDPVANNVFGGKSAVARFKLSGMFGKGLDFDHSSDNDTLIIGSIGDGLDPTPKEVTKYFNDLRYASFSRGDNTALAGTIYKTLQRSLTSITISPTPCQTKEGLIKLMDKNEVEFCVGKYIKASNGWTIIKDRAEADALLNKVVEMRSPQHCKAEGDTICYACMNYHYKHLPNGVSTIAANISGILLTMFLKLMHGVKTEIRSVDKLDLIN